jgi:hypothetical protein
MTPKFFSGHGFGSPLNERLARSSTPSIAACAPCYYEQVRRGLVIATALATVYFIVPLPRAAQARDDALASLTVVVRIRRDGRPGHGHYAHRALVNDNPRRPRTTPNDPERPRAITAPPI